MEDWTNASLSPKSASSIQEEHRLPGNADIEPDSNGFGSITQDASDIGIGFRQIEDGSKRWYFRRLVWTAPSPDSHQQSWSAAGWRWEVYDRHSEREKYSTSVMHGDGKMTLGNDVHYSPPVSHISSGVHVPAEILLCIVEHITGCAHVVKANICLAGLERIFADDAESDRLPEHLEAWMSGDWDHIAGIALACKDWFERYAPLVFSKVYLAEAEVEEFCERVKLADSPIRLYARSLTLRGAQPWSMAGRISVMLPQVSIIGCSTYHPLDRYTQREATHDTSQIIDQVPASLRILSLDNCLLPSAEQFARVIHSLPSLSVLTLESVTFERTDRSISGTIVNTNVTGADTSPPTIVLRGLNQDLVFHTLSLLINWSLSTDASTERDLLRHPALSNQELECIAKYIPGFATANMLETVVVRLEQCTVRDDTWVMLLTGSNGSDTDDFAMMLELHITRLESFHSDTRTTLTNLTSPLTSSDATGGQGYIRHIVIRDSSRQFYPSHHTWNQVQDFQSLFEDLIHLQTVTFERKTDDGESMFERDLMQKVFDAGNMRRRRTWMEAYDFARKAKSNLKAVDGVAISPLWASPRYKAIRGRCLELLGVAYTVATA